MNVRYPSTSDDVLFVGVLIELLPQLCVLGSELRFLQVGKVCI